MLIGALTCAGTALYIAFVRDGVAAVQTITVPWILLAAAFCLVEIHVVHVHIHKDSHAFSLSEIPMILGLFFVDPELFVIAKVLGAFIALGVWKRQTALKLAFNLSMLFVESCLAITVMRLLGNPATTIATQDWGAALVAAAVTATFGVLAIFTAIGLAEGHVDFKALGSSLGFAYIVGGTNTSLALVGATILAYRADAAYLLCVPALTLLAAYRGYAKQREKGLSLEFLYQSISAMHGSANVESAMVSFLSQARTMFRAEIVELVALPSGPNERPLRTVLGPGAAMELMRPVADLPREGAVADAITRGEAALLPRPARDEGLNARFGGEIHDAMIVPLRSDTRIVGTLIIANRLGDVSTFTADDLKLFQTLGDHVGVSLENSWLERSLTRVTELKEQMRHQSLHDALTGLANRVLFHARVEQALTLDRPGRNVAVMFADLDDFKTVNDGLGHAAGDALLIQVAGRISGCLRPEDTAARLGGDEFAILLGEVPDEGAAEMVATRILDTLREPFMIEGREVFVHASIGIAIGAPGEATAETLLRNADAAMYAAKNDGKNGYELFESHMHVTARRRVELIAELQRAYDRDEFVLHYQPIMHLPSNELRGVEALVRWNHPVRGLVAPAEFIGLAEDTGFILQLGDFVLEAACRQLASWQDILPSEFYIAVNVSPVQLRSDAFADSVRAAVAATGIDPRRLVLEITETTLMDHELIKDRVAALREVGVLLAIDDFGTGYSSIGRLQQLSFDVLKIDRTFVRELAGEATHGLARAIVEMAKSFNMSTVAEGVETEEQRTALRALGCDAAQGFLFSAAMSPEIARDYVIRHSAPLRVSLQLVG